MSQRVGHARCGLDKQDLTAHHEILLSLDGSDGRIHLDHGLTGTERDRLGPAQALANVRAGDNLVVPKLGGLARSVRDAREIDDSLTAFAFHVSLSIGGTFYDVADTAGKKFFNIPAFFAEFEVGALRMPARGGIPVARAKGKRNGEPLELTARRQTHLVRQQQSGEHTDADLAAFSNVSRTSVHRVLECHQNASATSTPGGQ
ncbi:recombinase family protein [Streptomyces fagopyri]|uniref:recombinase family protein n=1 Tax=Streptomyces fagopyri TaxID=2662397 RepID=UPI0033C6A086